MNGRLIQPVLLEDDTTQIALPIHIPQSKEAIEPESIEEELKRRVEGKMLQSYRQEMQGSGVLFFSYTNFVKRFFNRLEHNQDRILVAKASQDEGYVEKGWKIDSYDLINNGDSNIGGFLLKFQLEHDEEEDDIGTLDLQFNREDFSPTDFEGGELERDTFFDKTVETLEYLKLENRAE